jgi:hypothetical protein
MGNLEPAKGAYYAQDGDFPRHAALTVASGAPASADCRASDRIVGTTAGYAKQKMENAGYSQIRDLRKGCDNYWHGRALKDGLDVNVLVTPEGEVMTEGS